MTRLIPFDTEDFHVEVDSDGVAHVVLGAEGGMPTLGVKGHREISRVWRVLDDAADVRSILVRSRGKGFCAGGSMSLVSEMLHHETVRNRVMREARDLVYGIIDCDKPIVSAINGAAVGAGLSIALLADISICAREAKLIDGHTRIGVAAGDHAAVIWPLLCGMAKAKRALLLCETITGEEAERIGLVSSCVAAGDLMSAAGKVAVDLAKSSRNAVAWTKRSLNHWLRAMLPAFEHSLASEILGFAGADAHEGLRAAIEKRAANFQKEP
jgi:enoyl-CoA hydratase